MPRCSAVCTIARARGWVARASTAAAAWSNWVSLMAAWARYTAATCGLPCVSVPVLSKTTVLTWLVRSIAAASLNQMPNLAALPMPTIIAAGVAKPKAHGHAITNTATAFIKACTQSPCMLQVSAKVPSAINTTTGTNTAATLSAIRAIGALLPCASASAFIISPRRVWLPSCSAR